MFAFALALGAAWMPGPAQAHAPASPSLAAADQLAPRKVCTQKRSRQLTIRVQNLLPTPVTLTASGVNCDDWSYTGNPTNINGTEIAPATPDVLGWGGYLWRNELAYSSRRDPFTLSVDGGEFGTGLGNVSLRLSWTADHDNRTFVKIIGGTEERIGREQCFTRRLNFTKAPRTTEFPPARTSGSPALLQIYSDGSRIVVRSCMFTDGYVEG